MNKPCILALTATLAVASAVASCSAVPADSRIGIIAPDETPFVMANSAIGNYFGLRCGSLDCHGQPGRNMRVWSCFGMRLDPHDISSCAGIGAGAEATTLPEYEATYRSIVGLEPIVMSTVVAGHGAHPELLTLVRKARGLEAHKGGKLITPGDDQDVCITSWLAGNYDMQACGLATTYPMFPMPDASTE